ncbi:MAG TPA: YqgE/AlgH family protein [Verrucomicrobiae bacterium]|nr:YqgE/AlgH family protein [Verrucomicrobiae bacterium]
MGFEFQERASLTGLVLAATPELLDPNFHETVVYLAEHGAKGALGFVMNRPLGRTLAEATASTDFPEALRDIGVFQGGPVKPTGLLFARFARGKDDEELRCDILVDPAELAGANKPPGLIRAFAGYAGWGEGQLEKELQQRAWKVCRSHVALLEEPVPSALWLAFVGEDQRWRKLQSLLPKNGGQN